MDIMPPRFLLTGNPPVVGGNNPIRTRRHVDFTPPHSCRYWKPSPQNDWGGGIKKLEWSGVWAAHRLFAFGRPDETACGMHTTSFASGRPNETACGTHTASLASEMMLQEGGGTNALLPTCGFPLSSPSPSSFPFLLPFFLLPPSVFVTWHATVGVFVR